MSRPGKELKGRRGNFKRPGVAPGGGGEGSRLSNPKKVWAETAFKGVVEERRAEGDQE